MVAKTRVSTRISRLIECSFKVNLSELQKYFFQTRESLKYVLLNIQWPALNGNYKFCRVLNYANQQSITSFGGFKDAFQRRFKDVFGDFKDAISGLCYFLAVCKLNVHLMKLDR